jgi:glutamate dehydrogenase
MEQTLAAHPAIVSRIVALFHARLNPEHGSNRDALQQQLVDEIKACLDGVPNADEDRILRRFFYLVRSTLRTNPLGALGRRREETVPLLQVRFRAGAGAPDPRPLFEIWVYSTSFEAIHLRGGKVARGGLRWSDRPEGFPHRDPGPHEGADGEERSHRAGGLERRLRAEGRAARFGRENYLKYGQECYRNFLRGLLDVTDNLVGGKVVPPRDVVRTIPTIRTSSWPRTRARRPSRHRQLDLGRIRLLAGRRVRFRRAASATTTRRWGSPRAARGRA